MPLGVVARSGSYTLNRPGRSGLADKPSFLLDSSIVSLERTSSVGSDGSRNERGRDDFVLKTYANILRSLYSCFDSASSKTEDSFVNSQEWTLSRCVPDLKLGVVGSLLSGKSALVHRYLTGAYMQEESPEGGRFKKEVVIEGQPYVLLIRDEGGPPEQQFAHWVDAVIFVFSLENEQSFNAVYNFYAKMAHFRNTADIPMILVGTQDAISESNPRVIDDSRARKLANDLKRCTYYETCATYGLNVERVFRDACVKIIQQRQLLHQQHNHVSPSPSSSISCQSSVPGAVAFPPSSCPNTPSHQSTNGHQARFNFFPPLPATASATSATASSSSNSVSQAHHHRSQVEPGVTGALSSYSHSSLYGHHHSGSLVSSTGSNYLQSYNNNNNNPSSSATNVAILAPSTASPIRKQTSGSTSSNSPTFLASGVSPTASNHSVSSLQQYQPYQSTPATSAFKDQQEAKQANSFSSGSGGSGRERGGIVNLTFNDNTLVDGNQLATPSSTPTTQRKNRRISNIFNRKEDDKMKNGGIDPAGIGVGRAIPVKQGQLYKRSSKSLNKEWKKKYVCLYPDGRLTYHPNIKDYMDEVHGKEVFLGHTTVKVPGQRPRGAQQRAMTQPITTNGLVNRELSSVKMGNRDRMNITGFDLIQEGRAGDHSFAVAPGTSDDSSRFETPNMKKKEKKLLRKPGGLKNSENEDGETYDFIIVSIDNRQWHFEANSAEERDEWVLAIEQQIFSSLQGNESNKRLSNSRACGDRTKVQALRNIPGNAHCADCGASDPDWVSLNLGAMICIECSGIHRNLGTHISKVRSLDLDELPLEYINVMQSLGNNLVNSIWEHDTKGKQKPSSNSSREAKETWIRLKYEKKEFLTPLPSSSAPLTAQLAEAMFKKDLRLVVFLLAHCTPSQINSPVGPRDLRTPLHLAAAVGSGTLTQLLLWYNADVAAVDHDGRTALWYAKNSGSQECMDILIRNGCASDFISSTGPNSAAPNVSSSSLSQNSAGNGGRQQSESQSDSSSATLSKRKQPGAVGTSNGSGQGSASSRSSCGSAFEKLPASVI